MRLSFRSIEDGGVEDRIRMSKGAAERIMEFEMRQARYRMEEIGARDKVQAGRLSDLEARKIMTRAKMHEKDYGGSPQFEQSAMAGADYNSTNMMLEEILESDDLEGPPPLMWFYRLVGFDIFYARVMSARKRRRQPDFVHPFPLVSRLVASTAFDLVVGLLMLLNGLILGFQVSYPDMSKIFDLVDYPFSVSFVIEVILRIMAEGWTWVVDRANFGDLFLIMVTGVLPMWVLKPVGINPGILRGFAVLRVLRLVRLVRMVRTYAMFRIFWSLIQGVVESGRTLLYTYILLGMVLYIFAIFAVYSMGKDPALADNDLAQAYFADVPKAMFSLFQFATLDVWAEQVRELMPHSNFVLPFSLLNIGIVHLVLLNLVLGVIVENAFERGKQDHALQAVQKREAMEQEFKELEELFAEIDEDQSGVLCKQEYDNALVHNEKVKAKFEILEIPESEHEEIWQLLDDGNGEVDVATFASCLRKMKGGAKSKDSFSILRRVHRANESLVALSGRLAGHRQEATALQQEAAEVREQLGLLQDEMCEFIALLGQCVPTAPADVRAFQIEKHAEDLQNEAAAYL